MDNTEDFFKNYRGKYSQYWIERWGLIPELPTSYDNANSMYELVAWLQRAFKNLLDDFQQLEAEFEDFKNALIDLLEYLIPELIRRYSNSAEFRALFIIMLEDILAGEERNWVKDLLKELLEVDMREWIEAYLKERLEENENNSYLITGNTELGGNEPRELFKASLKSVRDTIDTTKFNIALGTDFHVDERTNPRYVNASLAYSHFNNLLYFDDKVDVTIVNGDNVDAMYSSLDRIKLETEAMVSKFLDNDTHSDVFIHLGNHDDGSGRGTAKNCPLDGFIKLEEYKEIYRTKQLLNRENRNNGSLYYYKDYPEKKIRLIGLYTEDITETITNEQGFLKYTRWLTHTIQQEQMDWLMNVALKNVPVDYHTVVIGHCPLYHGWTDNGAKQINHEFLKNVLLAFQKGTSFIGTSGEADFPLSINCDFTVQGPRKLVGFFGGHTHREFIDDWDGIKNVSCLHSIDIASSLNANTIEEDAQTIISIDTNASRVNLIGYGRATNRSYYY